MPLGCVDPDLQEEGRRAGGPLQLRVVNNPFSGNKIRQGPMPLLFPEDKNVLQVLPTAFNCFLRNNTQHFQLILKLQIQKAVRLFGALKGPECVKADILQNKSNSIEIFPKSHLFSGSVYKSIK